MFEPDNVVAALLCYFPLKIQVNLGLNTRMREQTSKVTLNTWPMVSFSHEFTSRGRRVFFLIGGTGEGAVGGWATRFSGGEETGRRGEDLGCGGGVIVEGPAPETGGVLEPAP